MTTARELAWRFQEDDPADVFLEQAVEYREIAREAERRALYHAGSGDLWVAYDEAMDARWGLALAAVNVVALLATWANREAQRRRQTLDCGSTEGEQLAIGGGDA